MPLRNAFYGFVLGAIFSTNGMAKPFPKGAGIVCPVRDANLANESWTDSAGGQHLIWSDSNIIFILIRDQWQYAEPSDGAYDWSYLDKGLNLARSYGKPIVISVDGAAAP